MHPWSLTVFGVGALTVEWVGASTVEFGDSTGLGAWSEFWLDTGYDVFIQFTKSALEKDDEIQKLDCLDFRRMYSVDFLQLTLGGSVPPPPIMIVVRSCWPHGTSVSSWLHRMRSLRFRVLWALRWRRWAVVPKITRPSGLLLGTFLLLPTSVHSKAALALALTPPTATARIEADARRNSIAWVRLMVPMQSYFSCWNDGMTTVDWFRWIIVDSYGLSCNEFNIPLIWCFVDWCGGRRTNDVVDDDRWWWWWWWWSRHVVGCCCWCWGWSFTTHEFVGVLGA